MILESSSGKYSSRETITYRTTNQKEMVFFSRKNLWRLRIGNVIVGKYKRIDYKGMFVTVVVLIVTEKKFVENEWGIFH